MKLENYKPYCLYYRTNKRTKWRYAEYGGCYNSTDEAVTVLKEHIKTFAEYIIECDGEIIKEGSIN